MVDRRRAARSQRAFNRVFEVLFRLRRGRLAYRAAPATILITTGRRSGAERRTPLLYLDLGDDRMVLVASNGGDDRTPAWVHNLLAQPDVHAELRGGRRPFTARLATPEERAEWWPCAVAMYGGYASYQQKTEREIPLVVLTPR